MPRRTSRSWCCVTRLPCCAEATLVRQCRGSTAPCSARWAGCCRPRCASCGWCRPGRCCAGTPSSLPGAAPTRADAQADHAPHRRSALWCCRWPERIPAGAIDGFKVSWSDSATPWPPRPSGRSSRTPDSIPATTSQPDLVAVPPQASPHHPRGRFRPRRHRLPAPPLRSRRDRARPSPRAPCGDHRPSDRRLGHAAGPQPALGPRRPSRAVPVPDPRPGQQVHYRVRPGLRWRRYPDHPHPDPGTSRKRDRGTANRHQTSLYQEICQTTWDLRRARCGESRTAGSGSGPGKRAGRKTGTAPRTDFTTGTDLTDHCINVRPRAALPHTPVRLSGRYDETGSAASYTNTCRSHDVTGFPAPTGQQGRGMARSDHRLLVAALKKQPRETA